MNTMTWNALNGRQRSMQGWAASLTFHSLAVGVAMVVLSDLKLAPQAEPFRWDVSVVETPAPQAQATPAPQPPPPTPAQPQAKAEPVKSKPVETPPPVKTVQPVQTVQAVRKEIRETKRVVETSDPIVQQTVVQPQQTISQTAEPVLEARPVETPTIVEAPRPMQQTQTMTAAQPVESHQPVETHQPIENHQIVEHLTPRQQVEPVVASAAPIKEAQPVMRETPSVTTESEPVTQQVVTEKTPVAAPAESVVSQRVEAAVPQQVQTATATHTSPVTERQSVTHEPVTQDVRPAPIEEASVRHVPAQPLPRAKADYGWLAEALWSRVEQLKRYPPIARMNRWEGKVVLRAVIKDTGDVTELEIAQSSGHAILDRDAIEVIRRASPLKLKHPLGQRQVVVHVPISYHLRK